jgi:hypothetical protein
MAAETSIIALDGCDTRVLVRNEGDLKVTGLRVGVRQSLLVIPRK